MRTLPLQVKLRFNAIESEERLIHIADGDAYPLIAGGPKDYICKDYAETIIKAAQAYSTMDKAVLRMKERKLDLATSTLEAIIGAKLGTMLRGCDLQLAAKEGLSEIEKVKL